MSTPKETQPLLGSVDKTQLKPITTTTNESNPPPSGTNTTLVVFSVALLLTSVANSVFFKQMTDHMMNYPFFLSQLSTLIYIPVFFGIVFIRWSEISPEMKAFPKSKFFYMGLFDAISGVLSMIGAVHTSGGLQALLSNAIIPVTMILSFFYLGERFNFYQISGSGLITIAVILAVLPLFLGHGGDDENGGDNQLIFVLLFVLNNIPSAFGAVYKEVVFSQMEMNENFLQAWVALFQLVLGVALIPLNTMKMLGRDAVAYEDIGGILYRGFFCLLGYNMIVPPHCISFHDSSALSNFMDEVAQSAGGISTLLPPCDVCHGAWVPTSLYLGVNLLYNWLMVVIIKVPGGGAALLYIIMALRLPLLQLAFASTWIQNPPEPIRLINVIVLAFILAGLYLYNSGGGSTIATSARLNINWVKVDSIQKEYLMSDNEQAQMIRNEWISTVLAGGATPGTRGPSGGEIRRQQERARLQHGLALNGLANDDDDDDDDDDGDDSGNIDNYLSNPEDAYLHINLEQLETPAVTGTMQPISHQPPTGSIFETRPRKASSVILPNFINQHQQPSLYPLPPGCSLTDDDDDNDTATPSRSQFISYGSINASSTSIAGSQGFPQSNSIFAGQQSPMIGSNPNCPPLPPSTLLNSSNFITKQGNVAASKFMATSSPAISSKLHQVLPSSICLQADTDPKIIPSSASTGQSPSLKSRSIVTASTPLRSSRARHQISNPLLPTPIDFETNSSSSSSTTTTTTTTSTNSIYTATAPLPAAATQQLGTFQSIKPPGTPSRQRAHAQYQGNPNTAASFTGLDIFSNSNSNSNSNTGLQTPSVRFHTADLDSLSASQSDLDNSHNNIDIEPMCSPQPPDGLPGQLQVALIDGSNPLYSTTPQLSSIGRSSDNIQLKSSIPNKLKANKKPLIATFSGVTATTLALPVTQIPLYSGSPTTPVNYSTSIHPGALSAHVSANSDEQIILHHDGQIITATTSMSSTGPSPFQYARTQQQLQKQSQSPLQQHQQQQQLSTQSAAYLSNHRPPSISLSVFSNPRTNTTPTNSSNNSFNSMTMRNHPSSVVHSATNAIPNNCSTSQTNPASKSSHFQPQPTPHQALSTNNTPIFSSNNIPLDQAQYTSLNSNMPSDTLANNQDSKLPNKIDSNTINLCNMTDLDLTATLSLQNSAHLSDTNLPQQVSDITILSPLEPPQPQLEQPQPQPQPRVIESPPQLQLLQKYPLENIAPVPTPIESGNLNNFLIGSDLQLENQIQLEVNQQPTLQNQAEGENLTSYHNHNDTSEIGISPIENDDVQDPSYTATVFNTTVLQQQQNKSQNKNQQSKRGNKKRR